MAFDEADVQRFHEFLAERAGGYLRNTIRVPLLTCEVCTTPWSGQPRCRRCRDDHREFGAQLADRVATIIYGIAGYQSGRAMRNYKAAYRIPEARNLVGFMLTVALMRHWGCPERGARQPISMWATVPSLSGRVDMHPLRAMLLKILSDRKEFELQTTGIAGREIRADKFVGPPSGNPLPGDTHVLLIDDTWTTGANVNSAVLTLREAGAATVSVLVVARWLNPEFGENADFIRDRLKSDYDPSICPWTGGACPP